MRRCNSTHATTVCALSDQPGRGLIATGDERETVAVRPLESKRMREQQPLSIGDRQYPQPKLAMKPGARTLVVVLPRLSIDENERQLLRVVAAQWLRDRVE